MIFFKMNFQFLHAADLHLDSPLRGMSVLGDELARQVRMAPRRALENMVDFAIRREVAFVIIAGDIYDGDWADSNTGLFFNRQLGKLAEVNIPVYIVYGNHDADSRIRKNLHAHLPHNTKVFDHKKAGTFSLQVNGADIALHGQSFKARTVEENLARSYPSAVPGHFNIGVLHTSLGGYREHAKHAPASRDDLAGKGYDYWALGHIHKREVVSKEPWIVYPGNLQGRHIGEADSENRKGATLVTVTDGRITDVCHEPLDELRWVKIEITLQPDDGEDDLYKKIRDAFAKQAADSNIPLIARLVVQGKSRASDIIRASRESFELTVRAAAENNSISLEKIRINTAPVEEPGEEITAAINGIANDDAAIARLLDGAKEDMNIIHQHVRDAIEEDSFLAKLRDGCHGEIADDVRNDLFARIRRGK